MTDLQAQLNSLQPVHLRLVKVSNSHKHFDK